jgi:hypothetical protein
MNKRTALLSILLCTAVLLPYKVCRAQSNDGFQPAVTNVMNASYPRIGLAATKDQLGRAW